MIDILVRRSKVKVSKTENHFCQSEKRNFFLFLIGFRYFLQIISCKWQQNIHQAFFVYLTVSNIKGPKGAEKVSFCAVWKIFIFYPISMGFLSFDSSQKVFILYHHVFAISYRFSDNSSGGFREGRSGRSPPLKKKLHICGQEKLQ